MLVCPKCNYKNRPNALYCTYCETWLADGVSSLSTTVVRKPRITAEDGYADEPGTDIFPEGGKLLLVIDGVTVALDVSRIITLGRDTPQSPLKSTVDLTPFGAYQKGVSRRHAEILLTQDNRLMLVDLGSSNGTYLNVERLVPHEQYSLHDGDQFCLSELVISIHYQDPDDHFSPLKSNSAYGDYSDYSDYNDYEHES